MVLKGLGKKFQKALYYIKLNLNFHNLTRFMSENLSQKCTHEGIILTKFQTPSKVEKKNTRWH